MTKVLIVGMTGMLGHTLFTELSKDENLVVYGTARELVESLAKHLAPEQLKRVYLNVDADNLDSVRKVFDEIKPDFVVNCIGLIKQRPDAKDPLSAIHLNAVLPHQLAKLTEDVGGRYMQVSTDCVFDGVKGNYTEEDKEFASDIYGTTKRLGEVDYGNALTIRTSIIGHELKSYASLVDWFLSQEGEVNGFTKAVFSGFPTVYLADIIDKYIIPNKNLKGLYHVSAEPISKYDLISLIAKRYSKEIKINPSEQLVIDRSLDSTRFRQETGFVSPSWEELVPIMHEHFLASPWYRDRK
ncbi:MAG: SDR family oxidoreductase [Candidatus Levyibacteriota bacterium]